MTVLTQVQPYLQKGRSHVVALSNLLGLYRCSNDMTNVFLWHSTLEAVTAEVFAFAPNGCFHVKSTTRCVGYIEVYSQPRAILKSIIRYQRDLEWMVDD